MEMNERITTLIVDDEPIARERVRSLLQQQPDFEVIGECTDGAEAIAAISAERPDLVFLDVQMPYADGFSVLKSIPSDALPLVVFVTAYDEYALNAFDVNAVDYLLKPFDAERFFEALSRVRRFVSDATERSETHERLRGLLDKTNATPAPLTRIAVRSSGQIRFLKVSEVDYIESEGNYVKLHVDSEHHLIKETMRSLEERLDAREFVRCHRSTIVNLNRIDRIEQWFQGDYCIVLHSGQRLPLSRRRYRELSDRLTGPR